MKLQWRKLYYELRGFQRCKNNWNSIVAHEAMLRYTSKPAILRPQNRGAERCRAPQVTAKIAELSACKASNSHSSMRIDRISVIFASLNSFHFVLWLTPLKLYSICGGYQLGSRCSNCISAVLSSGRCGTVSSTSVGLQSSRNWACKNFHEA